MANVRVRVTAGIGAWIVGATTATGLSLFAVSYLGDEPRNPQGATLSAEQVRRALASESGTAESPSDSDPGPTPPPTEAPSSATPAVPGHPSSMGSAHPTPTPSGTAAARPVVRQLSGDGGSVVAQCQGSTVYLTSWSPAQGYQAEGLHRGPARYATVLFVGFGNRIFAHVACPGGVPTLVVGDDAIGFDH